ncbi:MAG: hypothetical protein HFI86_05225 [Bacilli bacterium]|nr:hypothetical protein [Bacilli bacterium]
MNNEENKNQDLTYDFNFEDQVVKNNQDIQNNEVEVLSDDGFENLEEVNETNTEESKLEELQDEILEEIEETNNTEVKDDSNNKKIKILNKEFNFEDIILLIIGLVIVASIFLLPRIMNIFS